MDYKVFSKSELIDILDLIHESIRCKTEADLVSIVARLKDLVCADNGVCALGDNSGNIIKIININYPVDWLDMYAKEELYKKDPVVHYNFKFFKTCLWSEAIEAFPDKLYTDLMNMASEFRLKYGVAGGLHSLENKGSIFSFSSEKNRFRAHHKKILDILMPHVNQALERVCMERKVYDMPLSSREKEVLKWMKEGKTNWEIAAILAISERTVKFHVQNIERKLNAVSKAHAIAIAMEAGLVS